MDKAPASRTIGAARRPWTLVVLALWNLFLTFSTGLFLWELTGPLGKVDSPATVFGWLCLAVAFIAPFGFAASSYGLWHLRPWGRYLFLVLSTIYFGLYLISVWLPGNLLAGSLGPAPIQQSRLWATVRYGLALLVPLGYLNLSWIKILFTDKEERL